MFLLQFMVVDCVLSLGFLRWPLLSPNHFARVDAGSPLELVAAAKATNTAALVVLVALGAYGVALASPSPSCVLKVVSLVALTRLLAAG